jgi:hypothetical protein
LAYGEVVPAVWGAAPLERGARVPVARRRPGASENAFQKIRQMGPRDEKVGFLGGHV